jgi:hypothetical protein
LALKRQRQYNQEFKTTWAARVVQVVEYLPNKHEALSLNLPPERKKKKKESLRPAWAR